MEVPAEVVHQLHGEHLLHEDRRSQKPDATGRHQGSQGQSGWEICRSVHHCRLSFRRPHVMPSWTAGEMESAGNVHEVRRIHCQKGALMTKVPHRAPHVLDDDLP